MHGVAYNLENERDCDLGLVCDFSQQSLTTAHTKIKALPWIVNVYMTWTL